MAGEVSPALGFFPACFGGQTRVVGFGGWESHAQGSAVLGAGQGCPHLLPVLCSCPPQVDPYLPYEYTCEGMLERIHAYIQHQVGENPCPHGQLSLFSLGSIPVLPWALCSRCPDCREHQEMGLGEVCHRPKVLRTPGGAGAGSGPFCCRE